MSLSEINVNIPEQSFELDDELKLKCPFKLMISGQERSLTMGRGAWAPQYLAQTIVKVGFGAHPPL